MIDFDLEDWRYRQPQGFAHYKCERENNSCGWFWWLTTTTFVVQTILENLGTRNTIVKREKLYSWRLEIGFGEWLDPETNADESRMRSRKERQLSGPSPRSLSLLHNLRLIPIAVERLKTEKFALLLHCHKLTTFLRILSTVTVDAKHDTRLDSPISVGRKLMW